MALDSGNVDIALTGTVSLNVTGSGSAPSDADTALGSGWTDLGYVSEDGVAETRDRSTNAIRAWQNRATVRTVVTDAEARFTFTALESKSAVIEAFYAGTVDADGGVVVNPGRTGGRKGWVIDYVDGTKLFRVYIPAGELVEAPSDVVANGTDPLGYEFIITAYPDDSILDDDGNPGSYVRWQSDLAA